MPCGIIPMKIFDENKRRYAQREEHSFKNYLEFLNPKVYVGPGKEEKLRLKAYALTHIDMLESTMLDTCRDMAGLGIPQAYKLFKKQLSDLEKTKEHALNGYLESDIRRRILWHEIGDIWGHANDDVEKLPLIAAEASKKEIAKAA